MTLAEEFKSRNFSIYGQWTGVLCIILCFALGIANIFHATFVIAFSIVCLVSAFLIIFVEIPLLLRICPTSAKFDGFMRKIETNYMRAAFYAVLGAVQWISIWPQATSLIVCAIFLTLAAVFYALAGFKGQAFQGSKTLGGQGVAQMII
ncbi:Golgi apparatus membrane protein TVP18 [Stagonosporopsis vannaccii]|nr:Golgi apparatus membrane protein TVP18 [Stagonosporopsis vannaccii]